MGRLTLNILLSSAQVEREVTSEANPGQIRYAASQGRVAQLRQCLKADSGRNISAMCNLYSHPNSQQAILQFTRAMIDRTGNLP